MRRASTRDFTVNKDCEINEKKGIIQLKVAFYRIYYTLYGTKQKMDK